MRPEYIRRGQWAELDRRITELRSLAGRPDLEEPDDWESGARMLGLAMLTVLAVLLLTVAYFVWRAL